MHIQGRCRYLKKIKWENSLVGIYDTNWGTNNTNLFYHCMVQDERLYHRLVPPYHLSLVHLFCHLGVLLRLRVTFQLTVPRWLLPPWSWNCGVPWSPQLHPPLVPCGRSHIDSSHHIRSPHQSARTIVVTHHYDNFPATGQQIFLFSSVKYEIIYIIIASSIDHRENHKH